MTTGDDCEAVLQFEGGTLVAPVLPPGLTVDDFKGLLVKDHRTGTFRAKAMDYRDLILGARARGSPFRDEAKRFEPLPLALLRTIRPHPHQVAALAAWRAQDARGIVELPTGAGKTVLGLLAMVAVQRPTLVVVPTLDLVQQWQRVLEDNLDLHVGVLAGGTSDRQPVTVTTYDSAALQTEFHGNYFGFLICDECHHLPTARYRFIAEGSVAPYRLGLTATLARSDGGERLCEALLGPLAHRTEIHTLGAAFLAPYDVKSIEVALSADEQARHDVARERYLAFVRGSGIALGSPQGWVQFLALSQRTEEGRAAYRAYREQRRLAWRAESKLQVLFELLVEHREDRILVFTDDNETAYGIAERFLVPALTHQTALSERQALLKAFGAGELPVLVTSRVLNEGVDVPDARVGIVLSGTGSVREHVQRLGRILRARPGKRAVLYEVTTRGTAESKTRERRRQHRAYQREDGC